MIMFILVLVTSFIFTLDLFTYHIFSPWLMVI